MKLGLMMLNMLKPKSEWELIPIGELCLKITSGGTPSRKNPSFYENGTINWVKTGELKDWYIDTTQEKITDEAIRQSSAKIFPPDTVLFAMYGDGRTIGSLGILRYSSATNQACCAMILDKSKCLTMFLFYSLMNNRNKLVSLALGGSQRNLNTGTIRNFKIGVPNLAIQQKIASILSAYDDLIENNTRRIQILEEMARRIYEEWFVRFRFPRHENVKMVESELGFIPEGWEVKKLGEIAEEIKVSVDPTKIQPLTPYVGLEHIPRRSIALIEWGNAKDVQSTKHTFKAGNILFGKIRPYFHKVAVAPIDGICSSDAIVIDAKRKEMFPFVLGTVSSDNFVQHATQISNGVKMPRTNWNILIEYPVNIPTNDLRKKFSEFVESSLAQIKNLTFKINNLKQTRDLLLPKLISGEIDVSEFPEPKDLRKAQGKAHESK